MCEKWVVAYETCDMKQERYLWVRDSKGEIVIFSSRQEARRWVMKEISFGFETDDVVYIRLPQPGA